MSITEPIYSKYYFTTRTADENVISVEIEENVVL